MSENNRLGMGDKFLIETGNDIVANVQKLKEVQKSASKYEKEQIAWEILNLTQRLNDQTVKDMKERAINELASSENTPTGDLKQILEKYIQDIDALENAMKISRQAQEESSKDAWYDVFSKQEKLSALLTIQANREAEDAIKPSETPVSSPVPETPQQTLVTKPMQEKAVTPKKHKSQPVDKREGKQYNKTTDIDREARGRKKPEPWIFNQTTDIDREARGIKKPELKPGLEKPTNTPESKIRDYLVGKGFIETEKGIYKKGKDDMNIVVKNDKVGHEKKGRLTLDEQLQLAEVAKMLSIK